MATKLIVIVGITGNQVWTATSQKTLQDALKFIACLFCIAS